MVFQHPGHTLQVLGQSSFARGKSSLVFDFLQMRFTNFDDGSYPANHEQSFLIILRRLFIFQKNSPSLSEQGHVQQVNGQSSFARGKSSSVSDFLQMFFTNLDDGSYPANHEQFFLMILPRLFIFQKNFPSLSPHSDDVDGAFEGTIDGKSDGVSEAGKEGTSEGESVGESVGDSVGGSEASKEGAIEGDSLIERIEGGEEGT